nr:MAG TPA: hypothetical protein [Caudoviricetes sp.]
MLRQDQVLVLLLTDSRLNMLTDHIHNLEN